MCLAGLGALVAAGRSVGLLAWLLTVGYGLATLLIGGVARRRLGAGSATFAALAAIDVGFIFSMAALLASPVQYAAALFLSLLALEAAHAALGVAPALVVVCGSVLAYVALVTNAAERGTLGSGAGTAAASMLVLYLGVALLDVVRRARFNRRLGRIVTLFALAERGEFREAYDDRNDGAADGLTIVGRAFNHLRGELATLVLTDALTGCLNRRGFDQELARATARAARHAGELSLLAVDIDRFKRINDTAGHLAGDTVLREVAQLIVQFARVGDVVGRVGGDELLLLLPGADLEAAGVVAERISDVMRGHRFATTRGLERVTVSIGIAGEQIRDPHISNALRARADEALYVSKRLGRDRVTLWAPGIRSHATPPQSMLAVDALHRDGAMRRLERAD
jgi:diguanylate cyclase (GGDEF)-like protein